MLRRLSFYFVCLFLLSTLAVAFHHHDDGVDHADCPTCMAHHQQSDTGCVTPVFDIQQFVVRTIRVQPALAVVAKLFHSPANDRAPPA